MVMMGMILFAYLLKTLTRVILSTTSPNELVMMAGDDGRNCIGVSTKNSHESDSSVQNVSGNNLFVMVSDDGLNDYIFIVIESFEFVPYPSFESSTLLQEVAPSLSECSSGFGSHNMVSAPVEVQVR